MSSLSPQDFASAERPLLPQDDLACLKELERKVLWLSTWTVHNANHLRQNRDGLKVGGHQASSASMVTLLSALYFDVLRPQDRVAVKPHGSPAWHAVQYLLGRQTRDKLERFRGLGGAQSYPSRTKDTCDVDFSTGSMGFGVAATLFSSLVQDYLRLKQMVPNDRGPGRMVALLGEAELDEGNIFESMLEGWKHDVRNLWWVIDFNRQSLDTVVSDRLFGRFADIFRATGFEVVTLKYGKLLQQAFRGPGGGALMRWIDECPNSVYAVLTYKGGAAWRERLLRDIGTASGIRSLLDGHDDASLQRLMTNLAGHDMETVLEAFHGAADEQPRCFIAYTIKGYGLPLAGHKDNHAGLLNPDQIANLRQSMGIAEGQEWEPFAGLTLPPERLRHFLDRVPFVQEGPRRYSAPPVPVPERLHAPAGGRMSTQEGFGRIMNDLGRGDSALASHVITTSPDVTVSTNLGGWVNQRGLFNREDRPDVFRDLKVVSPQKWAGSRRGQHVELGIAEQNLFLMLTAAGLAEPLFGARLLPVGTVYDPFIKRGLDALNYACYSDARFILVATPSGITLAPEGGAHQSVLTPLIGLAEPGLTSFEPAYVDELAEILRWSFVHMQAADGSSVYLRLTTRALEQPERSLTAGQLEDLIAGAYWQVPPEPGAELALVYTGAVAPEAAEAHRLLLEDVPGAGLLAVPSPDRLHAGWLRALRQRSDGDTAARAHVERLLEPLAADAALVSVLDGHSATLAWLGSVLGHSMRPLGVTEFGQSGDIVDLYRVHGIDSGAILDAAAAAMLARVKRR